MDQAIKNGQALLKQTTGDPDVFVNLLRSFFLFRLVLKSVGLVSGCALNLPKDKETLKSVFFTDTESPGLGRDSHPNHIFFDQQ